MADVPDLRVERRVILVALKHRAIAAERKANECANSGKSWDTGNLRIYQNIASKFWSEYYAALVASA
jgi:hypothetical protein